MELQKILSDIINEVVKQTFEVIMITEKEVFIKETVEKKKFSQRFNFFSSI
jgi:hypothetical protein